jgi:hypothetical protein
MAQQNPASNAFTFAAQPQTINPQIKKFREPYQELMYTNHAGKSRHRILCAIEEL